MARKVKASDSTQATDIQFVEAVQSKLLAVCNAANNFSLTGIYRRKFPEWNTAEKTLAMSNALTAAVNALTALDFSRLDALARPLATPEEWTSQFVEECAGAFHDPDFKETMQRRLHQLGVLAVLLRQAPPTTNDAPDGWTRHAKPLSEWAKDFDADPRTLRKHH